MKVYFLGIAGAGMSALASILVTEGNFTYVAIDDQGRPQTIAQDQPPMTA